ncbi:hypothetical protein D3C76_1284380 [compost metagenome]
MQVTQDRTLRRASVEHVGLAQSYALLIFGRQERLAFKWPLDCDLWIVPGNAAFAFGRVKIGFAQRYEAVRETCGDPQLLLVFRRQYRPDPFAEGRRGAANVHCHVEHFALDYAYQLALGMR